MRLLPFFISCSFISPLLLLCTFPNAHSMPSHPEQSPSLSHDDGAGLICYSCNSTACYDELSTEYCDKALGPQHCQATYKRLENGTFELQLLSCIAGSFTCTPGVCTARATGLEDVYYCCCDGNYCNGNMTFSQLPISTSPPLSHDNDTTNETSLFCYSQLCNSTSCSTEMKSQYCGDIDPSSPQHCQATYRRLEDGTFEPRLLSCFAGSFTCTPGVCIVHETQKENIYYCCCDGNYCNGNVTFPQLMPTTETMGTLPPTMSTDEEGTNDNPPQLFPLPPLSPSLPPPTPSLPPSSPNTGLYCYFQKCSGSVCPTERVSDYCGDVDESSTQHCQATYKKLEDGTFEPRLLSCFAGSLTCTPDVCIANELGIKDVYFCCCDGNNCNGNITFNDV